MVTFRVNYFKIVIQQLAHGHIKPKKLTVNYWYKSVMQTITYIGFMGLSIHELCVDLYLQHAPSVHMRERVIVVTLSVCLSIDRREGGLAMH